MVSIKEWNYETELEAIEQFVIGFIFCYVYYDNRLDIFDHGYDY